MAETHEWRVQNAVAGKARAFELRDLKAFTAVLTVRTKKPMTIEEIKRLMSLAK